MPSKIAFMKIVFCFLSIVILVPSYGQEYSGNTFLGVRLNEGYANGLTVSEVVTASPAASAGIKIGDVLVKADGIQITGLEEFSNYLDRKGPERIVNLSLIRDTKAVSVKVKLSQTPSSNPQEPPVDRIDNRHERPEKSSGSPSPTEKSSDNSMPVSIFIFLIFFHWGAIISVLEFYNKGLNNDELNGRVLQVGAFIFMFLGLISTLVAPSMFELSESWSLTVQYLGTVLFCISLSVALINFENNQLKYLGVAVGTLAWALMIRFRILEFKSFQFPLSTLHGDIYSVVLFFKIFLLVLFAISAACFLSYILMRHEHGAESTLIAKIGSALGFLFSVIEIIWEIVNFTKKTISILPF